MSRVRGGTVYFVGAGPGASDLITVRGARILEKAGRVIYAGSLVDERAMAELAPKARWIDSSGLNREQIVAELVDGARSGEVVVRLASGDPGIFGAMAEMTTELSAMDIPWEVVPGVSSVFASAAALGMELTLPDVSQTVILTRTAGRTPMPPGEGLADLARHGSTIAIFLSVDRIDEIVDELLTVLSPQTPAAVVARASWADETMMRGTLETIAPMVKASKIHRQAMLLVGRVFDPAVRSKVRSRLYSADFSHGFRDGTDKGASLPPDPSLN